MRSIRDEHANLLTTPAARGLALRHLVNYAGAALVLPYDETWEAAKGLGYLIG